MQTSLNSETPQTSKSRTTVSPRCSHLSPAGRRCSQPVCSSHPSLCFTHKPKLLSPEETILHELTKAAAKLSSPEDINRVLCKVFQALVQDRISLKKAGTLGFLAQTILRTQRDAVFHQKYAHELELQEEELNPPRVCGPWADEVDRKRAERSAAEAAAKASAQSAQSTAKPNEASLVLPELNSNQIEPVTSAVPQAIPMSIGAVPNNSTVTANPPKPSAKSAKPTKPTPPNTPDLNHFYPWDPTLPKGRQDSVHNIPPPAETPSPTFHSIARAAMRRYRAFLP